MTQNETFTHQDDVTSGRVTSSYVEIVEHVEHGTHNDGDHEVEEILRTLSSWNIGICLLVIILVMVVGLPITVFDLQTLYRIRRTPTRVAMMASLGYNLVTLIIILPLTFIGVANIGLVSEMYCYFQETLTFATILFGFLYPALLSFLRFDSVVHYNRRLLSVKITVVLVIVVNIIAIVLALTPVFTLTSGTEVVHAHGCHLWSVRVDEVVWYTIAALCSCLSICVTIMVYAYVRIFLRARNSVNKLKSHMAIDTVGQTRRSGLCHDKKVNQSRDVDDSGHESSTNGQHHNDAYSDSDVDGDAQISMQQSRSVAAPQAVTSENVTDHVERETNSRSSEKDSGQDSCNNQSESDYDTPHSEVEEYPRRGGETRRRPVRKLKQGKIRADKRVAVLAGFIVLTYIVFWSPWLIFNVVILKNSTHRAELRILMIVIGYIPTATDPILLAFMSPQIMTRLKSFVSRHLPFCCKVK